MSQSTIYTIYYAAGLLIIAIQLAVGDRRSAPERFGLTAVIVVTGSLGCVLAGEDLADAAMFGVWTAAFFGGYLYRLYVTVGHRIGRHR